MIQIWAELEKINELSDWAFDFIGGGEGFERIKRMAKDLKLNRINFLGFKNPEEDYKQASIFMMTSRFEGWPMVLMEAMQMGVVPVVFNSFESLTDIIDDGKNGCIVPDNNLTVFANRMKWLMTNDEIRHKMAANAIANCERFTIDKVVDKYLNLFYSIIDK